MYFLLILNLWSRREIDFKQSEKWKVTEVFQEGWLTQQDFHFHEITLVGVGKEGATLKDQFRRSS